MSAHSHLRQQRPGPRPPSSPSWTAACGPHCPPAQERQLTDLEYRPGVCSPGLQHCQALQRLREPQVCPARAAPRQGCKVSCCSAEHKRRALILAAASSAAACSWACLSPEAPSSLASSSGGMKSCTATAVRHQGTSSSKSTPRAYEQRQERGSAPRATLCNPETGTSKLAYGRVQHSQGDTCMWWPRLPSALYTAVVRRLSKLVSFRICSLVSWTPRACMQQVCEAAVEVNQREFGLQASVADTAGLKR